MGESFTIRRADRNNPDADTPLQAFRVRVEKGAYRNFAELRAAFRGVDKVGARYVFNVGDNKYRVK